MKSARKKNAACAAALAAVLGGSAAAETPPEAITWLTLVRINDFLDNPDDPTDRPPIIKTPPAGTLRPVDVSHDGKADWLVDFGKASVVGECGTGGCTQILYVSSGDTYVRAFEQQAFSLTTRKVAGETRVEAWVHDLHCAPREPECRFAWAWDTTTQRLQARPTEAGATLLARGGHSPIDLRADQAPESLAHWAAAQRHVCLVDYGEGYDVRLPALAIVPDVTGDGLDDWLATPTNPCASAEAAGGVMLWASDGRDDVSLAYVAGVEMTLSIDIGRRPASVLEVDPCGLDETCPGRALQWNATDHRFERSTDE